VTVRLASLALAGRLVLAAGGALLPLTLLGCSTNRGPSDQTTVVFDGQSDTIDGSVTCVTQPDGELVILATDSREKTVRVLLSREHQIVVRKVGVRLGNARGYTEDSRNMWATRVDDQYSINGRMPPNTDDARWHDFKIDVRCRYETTPTSRYRGP
jgi:Mycobacterium 19 kDa lipoprotein antigen